MSRYGKVWLAGAGPGDAGLLTVKTKRLMETADVIVYDALISAEILSLIPQEKELIYVGKRSGHHLVPQEEINKILLREVKKGKHVLRLKGGDPFVFGRGGEELELLKKENIPFEIVPGITSASAVPAYGGIPITHRDYTSSFHVITGHPRKDGSLRIDFPALVRFGGTLVFLMGLSSMETILNGLREAGMNPDTPAAVLEKGTLASQRRVVSTVGRLNDEAASAGIGSPAIILVGDVCALAERFHWAEDRPLGGVQILNTRPRNRSSVLSEKLKSMGAQVIELPAIYTRRITPNPVFRREMEILGTSSPEEWLVFTSPAGVEEFFLSLNEMGMDIRSILRRPADIKIAAIGKATEKSLGSYGILADLVPEKYCAKSLGEKIAREALEGSLITVLRAAKGSDELLPPLLDAGMEVQDISLYETVYETHGQIRDKIIELFEADEIDAVTFTSASTVNGFVMSMGNFDYRKIRAVCIGEQTAREAGKYGMEVLVSREADIDSMVELIVEEFTCLDTYAKE